jgi:hypothetical protein
MCLEHISISLSTSVSFLWALKGVNYLNLKRFNWIDQHLLKIFNKKLTDVDVHSTAATYVVCIFPSSRGKKSWK